MDPWRPLCPNFPRPLLPPLTCPGVCPVPLISVRKSFCKSNLSPSCWKGTIFLGGRKQHSCPIQDSCLFSLRFPLIFPCIPIFPTRNESILASIFLVSKGVYPWVAGWRSRRGEHHTTEAQGSGEAPHPLFGRTQEPPTPEEFIFSASLLLPQWRCLPPVACHRLLPDAGTELCLEIVGGWGGSTDGWE